MATASLKITVLLASALLAASASGQAKAAGMDSFVDLAHDADPLAPDIARVSVASSDDGKIVFDVAVTNYMYLPPEGALLVFIDSDRSGTTGSDGDDFAIKFLGSTNTIDLGRWNGTDWDYSVPATTLSATFLHGAQISINGRDLGNTESFDYWLASVYTAPAKRHFDLAPDGASRTFDLKLPKPAPSQNTPAPPTQGAPPSSSASSSTPSANASNATPTAPSTAPTNTRPVSPTGATGPIKAPQARLSVTEARTTSRVARRGKLFGVGIQVQQDATGELVTRGQIACSARVAGRPVKLVAKLFDAGMAICGWKVPRAARGRLTVSIRVRAGGASVTKRFTIRVV